MRQIAGCRVVVVVVSLRRLFVDASERPLGMVVEVVWLVVCGVVRRRPTQPGRVGVTAAQRR